MTLASVARALSIRTFSLFTIGAVLCSTPGWTAQAPGADSPQALVERIAAATERGDFAEVAACLDPESRGEMTKALVIGSTMMVAFAGFGAGMAESFSEAFDEDGGGADDEDGGGADDEGAGDQAAAEVEALTERYRSILAKHKLERILDEEPSGEEDFDQLLQDVDQVALIGDLLGFMESMPGESQSEQESSLIPGDLTSYEIDGDRATAQSPEGPVEFIKVDGRWYLKPDSDDGMDGEG